MGIKISALPSIAIPALTDVFPVVQAGVTYKETVQQLSDLIGGVVSGSIIGTANQIIVTPGVGNVTLSTPQDIATTSNVTFGSVTFSPTTKGIVGTPTNNNAAPGFVGEFISSTILNGSAVSFTTGVTQDLTSISLTAGDWDVFANVWLNAATSTSNIACWISSTSATPSDEAFQNITFPSGVSMVLGATAPYRRFSLSGGATVYISANVSGVGALTCSGGIYARRVR